MHERELQSLTTLPRPFVTAATPAAFTNRRRKRNSCSAFMRLRELRQRHHWPGECKMCGMIASGDGRRASLDQCVSLPAVQESTLMLLHYAGYVAGVRAWFTPGCSRAGANECGQEGRRAHGHSGPGWG